MLLFIAFFILTLIVRFPNSTFLWGLGIAFTFCLFVF